MVLARKNRADCCRRHPSNIASKVADSGSRCTTLSASTRASMPTDTESLGTADTDDNTTERVRGDCCDSHLQTTGTPSRPAAD
jgi:hypothetical protein